MKKLKLWMTQWLVDIGSCLTELGDRMIGKGSIWATTFSEMTMNC